MTDERRVKLQSVLDKRQYNLAVVMENIEDPHNISAVLRTCEAVGVQEIFIVNTTIPRHKKFGSEIGFRSSSSAAKWLTVHEFSDVDACVNTLKDDGYSLFSSVISAEAESLYDIDLTTKTALVFGNERAGISAEMVKMSDGIFRIPQVGIVQSLNISVACAVCLYEAFRQKSIAGHYNSSQHYSQKVRTLREKWGLEGAG